MTPEQLEQLSDMIAKKVLDNLHFNFEQDPNFNVMPAEEFLHKDVDAFGNAKFSEKDTLARQLTELMITKEKLIKEEKYELLQELQELYDKIKSDYDKL
jgi:predicted N-acyltransferase